MTQDQPDTIPAGALSGVNVLDLSRLLPGPYCSMILADHGARVIAAEDRRFQAEGLVSALYRNKEHMTLNLKSAGGMEIFRRLVRWADVMLEGFRPGVATRLGIDYASAQSLNPRIVFCSITGYGQTGHLSDRVGHDVNYLAHSGVLDLIGEADRRPCIPGIQIADVAGGGMNAAIGILLALFARAKTGRGQQIDISMTDGMLGFLPAVLYLRDLTGRMPGRSDSVLSHRYACFNTYDTADGRCLSIGAVENRFWARLCEHLGAPAYAALQYDEGRREEILAFMRKIFRQKTLARWDEELGGIDVCYAPVRRVEEALADPLFRERGALAEMTADGRPASTTLGVPVKLGATPGSVRTPPAAFGTHTRGILEEFGFTPAEIDGFERDGVV